MCLLIETIRVQDGLLQAVDAHERRMAKARMDMFGARDALRLDGIIVPPEHACGRVKCRVVYGTTIESVEFEPYKPRTVRSLRLVRDDDISYPHKFFDRRIFEDLLAKRGSCDDILIVKNGLITDTSFSNIAFDDGSGWITPASPLLPGTMRERLLAQGLIREEEIRPRDLWIFRRACLINAMLDFGECLINLDRISW